MRRCTHRGPSWIRSAALAAGLALATLVPLSACSDSAGSGTGRMSILLTDAPGDVKKAVVTISQIAMQGTGGEVVLLDTAVTTDLLTLAGSTAELVHDGVVPSGNYSQLRFVITGGYIEVDNGDGTSTIYASSPDYAGLPAGAQVGGSLQMPSFGQSGLKVTLPGGSVSISGDQKIVLVDFNVAQSFGHVAGTSGDWVMHPVIHATDFSTTGGITVTLTKDSTLAMPTVNGTALTLGNFSAVLTSDGAAPDTVAFTGDSAGTFAAHYPFHAAGAYSVDVIAPSGVSFTTDPAHPVAVMLSSGQSDTTAFKLVSATAP